MFNYTNSKPYLGGVYLCGALDGGELCDDAEDAVEGRLLQASLLEAVHHSPQEELLVPRA